MYGWLGRSLSSGSAMRSWTGVMPGATASPALAAATGSVAAEAGAAVGAAEPEPQPVTAAVASSRIATDVLGRWIVIGLSPSGLRGCNPRLVVGVGRGIVAATRSRGCGSGGGAGRKGSWIVAGTESARAS